MLLGVYSATGRPECLGPRLGPMRQPWGGDLLSGYAESERINALQL
jgi:hypothetical protein